MLLLQSLLLYLGPKRAPLTIHFYFVSGDLLDVASEGFEPPKAEPADLQSVPFGRLGN